MLRIRLVTDTIKQSGVYLPLGNEAYLVSYFPIESYD